MNKVQQKRIAFHKSIRRQQLNTLFTSIRKQMKRKSTLQMQDQLLLMAYDKIQTQEADYLNIYVNIQSLLSELLLDKENPLSQKAALWIFIKLTSSNEVMEYLANTSLASSWRSLQVFIGEFAGFEEFFYQRLFNLLQHLIQNKPDQLDQIITRENTTFLMGIEAEKQAESYYYELLPLYLSLIPISQLVTIINSGITTQSLQFSNQAIFYAILARLQSQSGQYRQLIELLLEQKQSIEAKLYS